MALIVKAKWKIDETRFTQNSKVHFSKFFYRSASYGFFLTRQNKWQLLLLLIEHSTNCRVLNAKLYAYRFQKLIYLHLFQNCFIKIWFKHILFRRKGLGVAYNATMPSPEEVFTKEPNHTHTHTHTHFQE